MMKIYSFCLNTALLKKTLTAVFDSNGRTHDTKFPILNENFAFRFTIFDTKKTQQNTRKHLELMTKTNNDEIEEKKIQQQ